MVFGPQAALDVQHAHAGVDGQRLDFLAVVGGAALAGNGIDPHRQALHAGRARLVGQLHRLPLGQRFEHQALAHQVAGGAARLVHLAHLHADDALGQGRRTDGGLEPGFVADHHVIIHLDVVDGHIRQRRRFRLIGADAQRVDRRLRAAHLGGHVGGDVVDAVADEHDDRVVAGDLGADLLHGAGDVGGLAVGGKASQVLDFLQFLEAGGEGEVLGDEVLAEALELRAQRLPDGLEPRRPVLHIGDGHAAGGVDEEQDGALGLGPADVAHHRLEEHGHEQRQRHDAQRQQRAGAQCPQAFAEAQVEGGRQDREQRERPDQPDERRVQRRRQQDERRARGPDGDERKLHPAGDGAPQLPERGVREQHEGCDDADQEPQVPAALAEDVDRAIAHGSARQCPHDRRDLQRRRLRRPDQGFPPPASWVDRTLRAKPSAQPR